MGVGGWGGMLTYTGTTCRCMGGGGWGGMLTYTGTSCRCVGGVGGHCHLYRDFLQVCVGGGGMTNCL